MARQKETPEITPDAAPAPDALVHFQNVSPLGALDVPAVGRVIQQGEVFAVRPDIAELLDGQVANFEPATADEFDAWVAAQAEADAEAIDEEGEGR